MSIIDPEHFYAHYTANGWVQSSGRPIKDWKLALVTWEKNERKRGGFGCKPVPVKTASMSAEELDRQLNALSSERGGK
jgi:hypothetical protein